MKIENLRILVTGGTGFIGTHLVKELVKNNKVTVIDFLKDKKLNPDAKYIDGDLTDKDFALKNIRDFDFVFHLAARSQVRGSSENPTAYVQQNIYLTYNVLEAMRINKVKNIMFASSSVVYGNAEQRPTKESYGPLKPISLYGASKLSCEALITGFCSTFDMNAWIFRFANVIGPHATHGVIFDLIHKLKKNPEELEVLGDGSQAKPFIYIDDCISGITTAIEKSAEQINILNVGPDDFVDVKTIAETVINEFEKVSGKGAKINYTGGIGGAGWKGDIKAITIDSSKLKSLGWSPQCNAKEAVRKSIHELIEEFK